MKKLFNFRLLVLIGVLIMSVPQVWAGKKTIYFDVQYIDWWKTDDVVKVHAWGGTETEDVSMTVYSGNMLTCQINDDQTSVCFYRYYNSKWNEQTINKTDAATKNCWTLWTSTSGSKNEISDGYEYEPTAGLLGGMNSWNAGTLSFDGDGNVEVALPAGQTYQFKILDGTTWYSYNSYGFSTSATDFTLYTSNSECSITTSTAGTYHFHWDRTNHTLCIFFPNDYAKARLTKSKYIYFDARKSDSDHWNQAAFASRFYFKYYDSGQDQSNTFVLASAALETSVYPVTVPNNDYIGRVQINRWSADGKEDWTNATSVIHAYTRSSSAENCIVIPDGQASSWTPSVEWTTYCPPMSSATLSDNSTRKISWQDGGNDGSTSGKAIWVSTNNTIEVSGAATKAVPDGNMTINYDFKVDGSSAQAGTGNTYSKGSLSNNTTYAVTMDAYNTYNSTAGTKLTASQTLYYKALNTYSVTHTLSNVTKASGRAGDDAAAYHVAYSATYTSNTGYCLPSDITVSIGGVTKTKGTDYTWTVTSGTSGSLSILTDKIEGNVVVTINGVVKYAMYGSLDDNDTEGAGMSGWSVADNYAYSDGTYTLVLSLTKPNTLYKFRVLDHKDNSSYGLETKAVIPENTATKLGSKVADAQLATAGTGDYTFTVVEDDGYPKITIVNPASHQITYGIVGDGGSWTSVVDGESNEIATGQYVKNEGSIIFTANPSTGYRVEGWYSNAECSTSYTSGSDGATISGAGNTVLALTVTKSRTVYAKFVPVTLTFNATTDATWNTASNWSPAKVPTIDHDVVLAKPVTVNIADAKAKSVVIDQYSGNTGKLTVDAGKALVVATTIQKKNAGGSTVATEETDIVLESDGSNGTGALVAGSESHNTKATVEFYTKAKKDARDKYINQYFGVPVDSVVKNPTFYGAYLRKFDVVNDAWASFSESKMYGFTAYRIMREETSEGTYEVKGNLILPGTTTHKDTVLTLQMYTGHDYDNMFANSWTAPIDVTKFDAENDFEGAIATIYVFNAGANGDGTSSAVTTASAGNWNSMPVAAVKAAVAENPDQTTYDLTQIPSQQAFLIQGDEGSKHQIKLNYKALVYDPIAENGATIVPARAPKRTMDAEVDLMQLNLKAESGLGDRVLLYVSDGFSTDKMDNGWEAYKLPGEAFAPQLCANTPLGEMSISATKDIEGTVLGFYAGTEDDHYTFSFDYNGEGTWYLNDLDENESTVIDSANEYQFTASKGTVAEKRFTVSKTPIHKTPTGIEDVDGGVNARKLMINGTLYIIRDGRIYNAEGSLVK